VCTQVIKQISEFLGYDDVRRIRADDLVAWKADCSPGLKQRPSATASSLRWLRADRLSSAVAHDGEFVLTRLSELREPQSQPYPDGERRARRKPKDQNDMGPGREEGLFGRKK
jgi:hypothetical protein